MTTTILILAAHWPVQVTAIDKHPAYPGDPLTGDVETPQFVVQPFNHAQSYVTDTRELRITEMLPEPAAQPDPAPVFDAPIVDRSGLPTDDMESPPPPSLPLADERTHGDDSAIDDTPSDRGPVGLADTDKYD